MASYFMVALTGTARSWLMNLPEVASVHSQANPEKIRTIEAMRPPARIKDVQKLMGCLAALSRFISRLVEWALLFFGLLHRSGPFV
jgi:hypothetical protein